jgi:hypothetical protein
MGRACNKTRLSRVFEAHHKTSTNRAFGGASKTQPNLKVLRFVRSFEPKNNEPFLKEVSDHESQSLDAYFRNVGAGRNARP